MYRCTVLGCIQVLSSSTLCRIYMCLVLSMVEKSIEIDNIFQYFHVLFTMLYCINKGTRAFIPEEGYVVNIIPIITRTLVFKVLNFP